MKESIKFLIVILALCCFALAMIIGFGFYWFMANQGSYAVERDLNQLIAQRDPASIAKVSYGEATKNFLMNLPEGTEASRTSSSQGAAWVTNEQGASVLKVYFVTNLSGKAVSIYMYEDNKSTFYYRLFPKWSIVQVQI